MNANTEKNADDLVQILMNVLGSRRGAQVRNLEIKWPGHIHVEAYGISDETICLDTTRGVTDNMSTMLEKPSGESVSIFLKRVRGAERAAFAAVWIGKEMPCEAEKWGDVFRVGDCSAVIFTNPAPEAGSIGPCSNGESGG